MRDGWIETSLGEIADVVGGGTPSTKIGEYWDGDIVWLTPTEITSQDGKVVSDSIRKITDLGFKNSGAQMLPINSVILTSRASVGFVALSGKELCTNQGFQSLIPKPSVLSKFIMFWIQQNRSEFESRSAGSTFKEISKSNVKSIKILLPPIPEQKRIVDLVSSVDSYIEAVQQQLESSKRSRNAVLHELLTAGGDDWVETTLGEICTDGLFADGDWVESKDQDPEGDYRLLQLADIGDGTFLNKSDRWMNREQFNRLGCTKLEVNDVLIARMPDPIGRACLFPDGLPTCATVVDVAIVRTGNETLQKFLALLINSSDFRTEAFSLLTGTTRQRISRGNLAKIAFAIPPTEKQLEIVNLISLFDIEIAKSAQVAEGAKQLRSGLLSDLLSGKHEIPASYDKVMGAA